MTHTAHEQLDHLSNWCDQMAQDGELSGYHQQLLGRYVLNARHNLQETPQAELTPEQRAYWTQHLEDAQRAVDIAKRMLGEI